ncbi:type I-E CRISPR-associated protein Cse2/CasB [Streptomonospora sp. S1-112]|uniref:Type I-E CRISPR-associated protein Cse2/CasB n=1 Tax=Streptomonospora mangrovi TaxID=2883123 RepID=A0A9X3NU63_9ACTN|nr:type I-E CRISPR-associated protein Cse2/CasB [Streptomonospora mangrovi]MDA0564156.1 type I-E CRISPR-associated protein Cse2/CasB [Streptomonospora mangrovi]
MSPPSATREDVRTRAGALVSAIRDLLDKPGDRAQVRRAVGMDPADPRCWDAYAHVEKHLPAKRDEATERAFLAVAALIADQPPTARANDLGRGPGDVDATTVPGEPGSPFTGNLGVTLAHAVERKAVGDKAAKERLHLLCRQNLHGAHRQLPRLIAYLRNQNLRVDWVQLACDLADWQRDHDRVVKNWLQGYHRTRHLLEAQRKKNAQTDRTDETP